MKRSEEVFFFTLVDFLVQVFFFSLVLVVVSRAAEAKRAAKRDEDERAVAAAVKAAGVSNLTELTDVLTRLAPNTTLRGVADFLQEGGDLDGAKKALAVVTKAGGIENVQERLERLRKLEEGFGKPPCVYDEFKGKRTPRSIARLGVYDDKVVVIEAYDEFRQLARRLGYSVDEVAQLAPEEFTERFLPIKKLQTDCRYWVDVEVRSQLLKPMDAVSNPFEVRRVQARESHQ